MVCENKIIGPLGWNYPFLNSVLREFDGGRLEKVVGAFKGNIVIKK